MKNTFRFEEPSVGMQRPTTSGLAGWIISHSGGLVKTERQANRILIILILTLFGILLLQNATQETVRIEAPPGKEIITEPGVPPRLQ
jgi:hypothetical protein